jgi:hypothetical protein
LCELAPKRLRRDEVDERPLAVDLDDRNQLAITRFELGIAVDRDLLQLEAELVAKRRDRLARAFAEVAALRTVEPDVTTDRDRASSSLRRRD